MEVQGKVQYGSASPSGGGGGGTVAGARNGVSLDTLNDVVLGDDFSVGTYKSALLNPRQIPMSGHNVRWVFDQVADDFTYFGINELAPTIYHSSPSAAGGRWNIWWPSNYGTNYAPWGQQDWWLSGYAVFPGVNEPTTPRPNVVGVYWSYNTDYTSGRITPSEAAFRWATETFFMIGADDYFEFHVPEMTTTTGNIFRLDSTYVQRQTAQGFREIVMNDITIYPTQFPPSTGQEYLQMQYNDAADATGFFLRSELAAGVSTIGLANWTDGASCIFTGQSGLVDLVGIVDIDLRSPRVIMDSSNWGNVVNPTIFSGNNTDSPQFDAWLEVGGTTPTKGSRPFPSMTTAQFAAISPSGITNPLFAYITDAPVGQELQFKVAAGPTHFINYT